MANGEGTNAKAVEAQRLLADKLYELHEQGIFTIDRYRGSIRERQELDAQFAEIADEMGLGDQGIDKVKMMADNIMMDWAKNGVPGSANDAKERMVGMGAKWLVEAGKLGTSIWQVAKSDAERKKLNLPEFQPRQPDTAQLDNLINDVAKKASGDFPQMRQARERDYIDVIERAKQSARDYGVSGSALLQAAAIGANKQRQAGQVGEEQMRMQYANILGGLLNQRDNIDKGVFDSKQRERLGVTVPMFQAQAEDLAAQRQAGIENIFNTVQNVPRDLVGTQRLLRQYQNIRKQVGEMDKADQETPSTTPAFMPESPYQFMPEDQEQFEELEKARQMKDITHQQAILGNL